MEELTESARQCLVSQGIVIGALSVINSLGLLLTGMVVIIRANYILHFTSLIHLAVLEIVCGSGSFLAVIYVWWIVAAYRNRQLEVRSKYLDENLSRGLIILILSLVISFSALVVGAVFLMLKIESSSTYDLKSAMSFYSTDATRKVIIDKLQIILECCGSLSLLDWFLIDWQNADLEPGMHFRNESYSDWDSVPFSCCCPEAPPPCIHHQLRTFGVGSLYTTGCADKLDGAVFLFVILAVIMLFISTFLMTILIYSSRKLQTSARSAVVKGDATAPGMWWLLSPARSFGTIESSDSTPLLGNSRFEMQRKNKLRPVEDYNVRLSRMAMRALLQPTKSKTKYTGSTVKEWETLKTDTQNYEIDYSEDWTRMANNASGSISSTSFTTTTRPFNSTTEMRHSISDMAVANPEMSHHCEHKFRPLYRS